MNLIRLEPAKGGSKNNLKHSICRSAFCFLAESRMETLKINGTEKQFPDGLPQMLTVLLKELNINAATVVAEIDGKIIAKENFSKTPLFSGQSIELIRFVGGG